MAGLIDLFTGDNADAMIAVGGGLLSRNPAAGFARAQNLLAEAPYRRLQMEQQRMQMEQAQMQMEQARQAQAKERGLLEMQAQFMQPGQQAQGGTADVNAALPPDMRIGAQAPIPGRAPQFDVSGYTAAAVQKGLMSPIDAFKLQSSMQPASAINKLDVKDFTPASVAKFQQTGNYADLERMDKLHFADTGGGVAGLNSFTGKPVNVVPKTGNPYSDLLLSDGRGGVMPNSPLIGAKASIAAAGAARNKVDIHNVAETEWSKTRAKDFAGIMETINKTSFTAPTQIRKLERMEQLLQGVDGGKLAPTGLDIASAANSLGIKMDPRLGNKEAAQALAREIAGGFRQPGTGPMTDKDFENFLLQVPDLSKTAEGRKQITATMKSAAARDIAIGQRAREYVKKNGRLDDNFIEEVSQFVAENPVVSMPKTWRVQR